MNTPTIEDVLKDLKAEYSGMEELVRLNKESGHEPDFAEGKMKGLEYAIRQLASLNRQGWTRVEDGLPETLGEDILICYEMGGQTIIEIGYLCGERLIKGTTERYPPVTHWMPLPNKPSI